MSTASRVNSVGPEHFTRAPNKKSTAASHLVFALLTSYHCREIVWFRSGVEESGTQAPTAHSSVRAKLRHSKRITPARGVFSLPKRARKSTFLPNWFYHG